ncbi:MAG: flagellin [Candidatus Poribacteria bacterium]|nr:MAG: flagellin [Candidatus Poribacteria bacterium]
MFRVNTNIAAINAQRQLFHVSNDLQTRMQRLSTGLRIVRAKDDPAGLSAAEGMRAQLAGQKTSNDNISRAITMLQTAEGGLEQIGSMLVRLKELAIQASDGTLNDDNRSAIQSEAFSLLNEIQRIASTTVFNGLTLLNTGGTSTFTFYVGDGTTATSSSNMTLAFSLGGVSLIGTATVAQQLYIGGTTINVSTNLFVSQNGVLPLVTEFDEGVNLIAKVRTQLGAFQNRLERAQSNLLVAIENTSAAESTIRDADFAVEASALTRAQILTQAGTAMLSQANLLPQNALALLGG